MCFVMLWRTTMQTFVPIYQQICILITFSNSSRFLHRIWLFCPKLAMSWHIQLGIIANTIFMLWTPLLANFMTFLLHTWILHIFSFFFGDFFHRNFKRKRCIFKTEISQKIDWIKLFYFCYVKYNSDTLQWDIFQLFFST